MDILDRPVPNSKIKYSPSENKFKIFPLLPKPLKPTKYVPPNQYQNLNQENPQSLCQGQY